VALTTDLSRTLTITEPLLLTGDIVESGPVTAGVKSLEAAFYPADTGVSPGLWQVSYFDNAGWRQPPAMAGDIAYDWGTGAPVPELGSDNFSVRWERETTVRVSGAMQFTATHDADAQVTVYVDNTPVLNTALGYLSRTVPIAAGVHTVYVSYQEGTGDAHVAFHMELVEPDWQSISLDQAGAGVISSTWSYTTPNDLEGFYRLAVRGEDQLGNQSTPPYTWNKWRGEIDTVPPRVSLEVYFTGFGSTERTHYVVSAEDFNLIEEGLDIPCDEGAIERYTYPTDWWQEWFEDDTRLFQVTAACSVPGFQTEPPTVQACDAHGRCTTLSADAPSVPNYRTIYWSDMDGGTSRIQYISLENIAAGPQTLVANAGLTVTLGIAIDPVNGHIYWTDENGGTIRRANLADGSAITTLVSGLDQPMGLAIDVAGDRLYWTEYGGGWIGRASLDGSGAITLTSAFTPTGIAVDTEAGKLYWMEHDYSNLVTKSDLDGSNQTWEFLAHESFCDDDKPAGIALDLVNRWAFWVDMSCTPDALNGYMDRGVYRAPIPLGATGTSRTYLAYTAQPMRYTGIAADGAGTKIYWTDDGRVWRANLNGTYTETVVSGLTAPAGIALNFNYAPNAPTMDVAVYENIPTAFTLPASDPDGDPLSFSNIGSPISGTLSGVPPTMTYTPDLDFAGLDVFTYTVSDGQGGSTVGTVYMNVLRLPGLDATILTPTHETVLTSTAPISVSGGAYAPGYLSNLTLTVDSTVVYTTAWPPASVTDTVWATTWDPGSSGEGEHVLDVRVSDHLGRVQTDTYPIVVWVDLALPAIGITPTLLTATHRLPSPGAVALMGTVTDTAGIAAVQVSVDGGAFQVAAVAGSTWTYPWPVSGSVDGGVYTVSSLATDVAGRTGQVTETVTVDVAPPSPVTMTLAYTSSLGARAPLSVGQVITDAPVTLVIEWTASSDGAGLSGYWAGWTLSRTADLAALAPHSTADRQHAQVPGEAQILYAHLVVQDVNGNATSQTLGPVYVDAPVTPDLIEDLGYRGWMESGGSQIGADREISRTHLLPMQELYTSWNTNTLRFTWSGAHWDGSGDLFIYLDTDPGAGTSVAYNPYTSTIPAIGLGAGFTANYLLWVGDDLTAWLMRWDAGDWVTDTLLTAANYQMDAGIRPVHTDLSVPFGWLGIGDPASTALKLVAFATEEGGLALWAAMPSHNPLNSGLVATPITPTQAFSLTRYYSWPSLGLNLVPNAGQFVDADLTVILTPQPAGATAGYLADDLLDFLPPGTFLDADLDGELDLPLPLAKDPLPLGYGQTVTYTITYGNQGTAVASGVTVSVTVRGALSLGGSQSRLITLPDIGPGISGTVSLTATVSGTGGSAELNAMVADATHGPFEWWWVQHDIDTEPPTGVTIWSPISYTQGLTNLVGASQTLRGAVESLDATQVLTGFVFGAVQDRSGVPTITLQVTTLPDNQVNTVTCVNQDLYAGIWVCGWPKVTSGAVSEVVLRTKATDGVGNVTPSWSAPVTLTVDGTPPTVSLEPGLALRLATEVINAETLVLNGTIEDDHQAAWVEVCDGDGAGCAEVDITPGGGMTGTWIYPFSLLPQGDGITQTIVLYGVDAVGNRSGPLTVTYEVDTHRDVRGGHGGAGCAGDDGDR
jgi:hypothetical protein